MSDLKDDQKTSELKQGFNGTAREKGPQKTHKKHETPDRDLHALVDQLNDKYKHLEGEDLVRAFVRDGIFGDRIALQSSFGAEAALLLDIVANVKPDLPVLFNDTLLHFDETIHYRDTLIEQLGLTNVISLKPASYDLAGLDPHNDIHTESKEKRDLCCHFRKVAPMARATAGYDALINGRKKAHGGKRQTLDLFSLEGGKIKIQPLIHWDEDRIDAEFKARGLPKHPLVAEGYLSIGCRPEQCTTRGKGREGRWAQDGAGKTECKLHFGDNDFQI